MAGTTKMYFSIAIILLVGIIAYFHYVQGLFSSVISAVCAAVSAAMAFSFHEPLAQLAFGTKMSDQGYGLALIALFAVIYLVLRTIFDGAVPGNVRLPAIVDKVGGAIAGAIAGAFAIGILAIGAQMLPFGPGIAGYSRYNLADQRPVQLPTNRQSLDAFTYDELKSDDLKVEDQQRMIVPVDDFVVGFINNLSDGGALSGERTLKSIHPAYLDEIFFGRLGVQLGAKHVAVNTAKTQGVKLNGAYAPESLEQGEGEIKEIRNRATLKTLASTRDKQVVVLRLTFAQVASDDDRMVRFSPGSVRLVADGVNYLSKGTLQGDVVLAARADDFLVAQADAPVDLAFEVDVKDALDGDKVKGFTFKNGVFVEAKRMARIDLSGMALVKALDEPAGGVLRKTTMVLTARTSGGGASSTPSAPAPTATSGSSAGNGGSAGSGGSATGERSAQSATAGANAVATGGPPELGPPPVKFDKITLSDSLFAPLNVGAHGDSGDVKNKSIVGTLKGGKLIRIVAEPNDPLEDFLKGDALVTDLYAPSGTKIVQVVCKPAGPDAWRWAADLPALELVDASDNKYQPTGALVKCTKGGKEYLAGNYNAEDPVTKIAKDSATTPTEITLIYLVPDSTELTHLAFGGKKVSDAKLSVK